MSQLGLNEIDFEPGSAVDPVGKVFHFRGRIFRAITSHYAPFIERALKFAYENKWFDHGLITTERAEYLLPGYPLVIEHKRIPFVTLRGEWSAEGLREAALCILRLNAELFRSNLCLKDSHPWNILFDGAKPYFIDWGSIRPIAELDWNFWYRQFRQFLLAPLYAFSIREAGIARAMLREHKYGVGNEIMHMSRFCDLPETPRQIAEAFRADHGVETLTQLADYVANLHIPTVEGEWTSYPQPQLDSLSGHAALREKDRIVHRILEQDKGRTLIDIGTNNGLHSEIGAALGKKVLACDIEETCLNAIYRRSATRGTDILPLFHDFLWPIGTSGIMNSIPAAEDRLACDTALFMAVTHHLAFKQLLSFEAMARGISRLAKRLAIVEFVPAEDEHVALWKPERLSWYNLDNFLTAMKAYFKNYTILASDPAPRCVIVFEKS